MTGIVTINGDESALGVKEEIEWTRVWNFIIGLLSRAAATVALLRVGRHTPWPASFRGQSGHVPHRHRQHRTEDKEVDANEERY